MNLGLAYLQKGLRTEALSELQTAVRKSDAEWARAALAYAHAAMGDRAEARRILRAVEARGQAPPFDLAMAYAALGDRDTAFAWLQQCFEGREIGLVMIRVMPQLAPLRADPRFEDLLRRMNLTQPPS